MGLGPRDVEERPADGQCPEEGLQAPAAAAAATAEAALPSDAAESHLPPRAQQR